MQIGFMHFVEQSQSRPELHSEVETGSSHFNLMKLFISAIKLSFTFDQKVE
jgi:hypothetical protein